MDMLTVVLLASAACIPRPTAGIIDDIRESLAGARKYLEDITPYIAQGLKMVQRVEDFVDSTIGEDCEYECPRGFRAVPRPGHKSEPNGCGAMDVHFDHSDTSLIHVEDGFTECCNSHDVCYDRCGSLRDDCDLAFKRCLYKVCKAPDKLEYFDAKKCRMKAKLAVLAVLGVGCQMFRDAQDKACECVRSKTKEEL